MAGALRHAPALDRLVESMDDEDSDVFGDVEDAIVRIDDPGTVAKLAAYARVASEDRWGFLISAASLAGRIKRPESEAWLVELLNAEEDPALLSTVAGSLLELLPTEPATLDAIRQLMADERYDRTVEHLEDAMVAMAEMVDYRPEELPRWRETAEAERAHLLKRLDETGADDWNGSDWDESDDEFDADEPYQGEPGAPYLPPLPAALDPYPEPVAPIRRTEAKVGRNDPCPCGSGKKYKKCCGK